MSNSRTIGIIIGIGLATLYIVGGMATILADRFVDFSLYIGLGIGILFGIVACYGAYSELSNRPYSSAKKTLISIAGFGYGVAFLYAINTLVEVHETYSPFIIFGLGILIAIITFIYLNKTAKTYSPMEG